jgi:D-amino-acid dehydrogenase
MALKIAVVGAGLVGLASAHALADDGHEVLVIDREGPAAGASRGNAGWLAHTDIDPIASPGMLMKVPGFLLDPVGPLAIRARYLLPILPWLARLLLAARPAQLARTIEAIVAINKLAMPAWNELSGQLGMESFIHRRGAFFAYDSEASLARARGHHQRQRAFGINVQEVPGHALRQMEPALSDALVGAAYYPDAAHVSDPRLVTEALFAACNPRGIGFLRAEVNGIAAAPGRATLSLAGLGERMFDRVVVAAGAWSRPLAAALGDRIPLDTERGYNVSFPGAAGTLTRPVSFDGHGFVATPLETGLRIGGAVELGGLQLEPNHARTRALYGKAVRFLREVPPIEAGTMWMGFRPSIPDSLPVIGTAAASRAVVYTFGHGHYGLTQSAVTGRIAADLISGRAPPIDLTPFSPQRF